jgi:hypothetical protein
VKAGGGCQFTPKGYAGEGHGRFWRWAQFSSARSVLLRLYGSGCYWVSAIAGRMKGSYIPLQALN